MTTILFKVLITGLLCLAVSAGFFLDNGNKKLEKIGEILVVVTLAIMLLALIGLIWIF